MLGIFSILRGDVKASIWLIHCKPWKILLLYQRSGPCKVPSRPNPTTRRGWPHHRVLLRPTWTDQCKCSWEGTYGFSSLSEKTRKSNHLRMLLKRQHFLLSYLKTLSVGPAGVWTYCLPLSRPALPTELTGRRLAKLSDLYPLEVEPSIMNPMFNKHSLRAVLLRC